MIYLCADCCFKQKQNKALCLVLEDKSSFICRVSNHNQKQIAVAVML